MTMPDNQEDDRELLARVSEALDVPEPSPLFWEHFPARVRAAVAAAPVTPARVWWARPRAIALAASIAIMAVAAGWTFRGPAARDTGEVSQQVLTTGEDAVDPGWAIVSSTAATAGVEALQDAGFAVRPASADAAIEDLTQAERAAFVALLQAEMKGDGPDGL
jgi:hypothetical protein